MKKINKFLFGILGITILLFSSCTEDIVRDPSPVVSENNETVYFSTANVTAYELDPTQTKAITLTVERLDSTNASEASLKIIRNDSNIFVFPEKISFAANQRKTTITVNFPDAGEGISYSFEVSIDGENSLNPYSTKIATTKVSVIRVKWDLVGEGQFYDSWTLYSAPKVDIYYSDLKKAYRFANPYTTALLEEAEWEDWIGGPSSDYIIFKITADKHVTWDSWYLGLNYVSGGENLGPIQAYFPSYLGDIRGITTYDVEDAQSIVDPDNDKLLRLFPRYYVIGVGGWGLKPCYISLPGGPDLTEMLDL